MEGVCKLTGFWFEVAIEERNFPLFENFVFPLQCGTEDVIGTFTGLL